MNNLCGLIFLLEISLSVVYSDLKVLEMGALIRTLRNKGGPTRSSWA